MTSAAPIPDEAASLLREAPEGFIAARDALVARLRASGRDDDAAVVKALRKPTVVAWALNQLSIRDPDGVRGLLDSGAEVRAAQQAALSSKRGATDRLRKAGAARKEAVRELTKTATEALTEAGRASQTHADAIGVALEACSVDPAAGAALSAGTLERPPSTGGGFGDVFGLTSLEGGVAPDEPPPGPERGVSRPRGGRAAGGTGATAADRATGAELRAEVARLRRDRDAVARRARKARGVADGFAHELEGMRRRLEVVERKHADAEAAASAGELELARAERDLKEATARLEDG
ncbi:MAG TPA: hypothetical protein VFI59_03800 [Actinomycetota bacterium]|nr:hypothetical protein [Actinomycetota bacterium]